MTDDHDPETDLSESLLPYEAWVEDAYREVMLRAIEQVSREGLPGEHHFYITFRTDHPGCDIPPRLRAQYPHEMTIVLQHQFWDLGVDRTRGRVSVGLSFGGIGSLLIIPIAAITAFADPHVRVAFRFDASEEAETEDDAHAPAEKPAETPPHEDAQVVRLDAFRRRPGTD